MNNPLSAFNTAAALQEYICDALLSSAELNSLSVHFLAENRQDIDYEIKRNLMQQGLVGLVMTPEMSYIGHDGAEVSYDVRGLTIQIVENVPVNRASNKVSCVTGLDVANYVQSYLGGPQAAIGFGQLCPVSIQQGEDNGLIVTKVTFDTRVDGGYGGRFEPVSSHVVFNPYVTRNDISGIIGMSAGWDAMSALLSAAVDGISAKADISSVAAISTDLSNAIDTKMDLSAHGDPTLLIKKAPYLYDVTYTDTCKDAADVYFKDLKDLIGKCSVVRDGNTIGRNYDWNLDERPTFIVRTPANGQRKFSSVATCGCPSAVTMQRVDDKQVTPTEWRAIPYFALDGINEKGVFCEINVVDADPEKTWPGESFCGIQAVREVLDNCSTALEGATLIAEGAWMPQGMAFHYLVADESSTYIVEDGEIIECGDTAVMTNFRINGDFLTDGSADPEKIAAYDPYGTGVERYNILKHRDLDGLRDCFFTNAYTGALPKRITEFSSREDDLKINDNAGLSAAQAIAEAAWPTHTRDGKFWQTVHSAKYDILKRKYLLTVQEGEQAYEVRLYNQEGYALSVDVQNALSTLERDVDLSVHNLSTYLKDEFYTKSETSSATEIHDALSTLEKDVDLSVSNLSNYLKEEFYTKSQTSSATELRDALSAKADLSGATFTGSVHIGAGDLWVRDWDNILQKDGQSLWAPLSERPVKDTIAISYSDDTHKITLKVDDLSTYVDATDFIKDGMVNNVYFDTVTKELVITFNTDAGKAPIRIPVDQFAKLYTAGDGLQLSGEQFSVDWTKIYRKTETSSASEISDALKNIDLSDYYMKSETSSSTELCGAFQEISNYVDGIDVAVFGGDKNHDVTYMIPVYKFADALSTINERIGHEPLPENPDIYDIVQNVVDIYDYYGIPSPEIATLGDLLRALNDIVISTDLSSDFTFSIKQVLEELNKDFCKQNVDAMLLSAAYDRLELSARNFITEQQSKDLHYLKNQTSSSVELAYAFDHIQLSDYYLKTETSSAAEISDALKNIELSDYYTKSETSSAEELSIEFQKSSHDDVLSGEVAKLEVALYGGDRDMNVTSALYLKHLGDQIWAADNMLSIPAPADAELTSLIENVREIYEHFGITPPEMDDLPTLFNAVHEIALNTELSSVFKLSMKQAVYDLTDDVTKINGDVIRLSSQIKHLNVPTRMSQLSNDVGFMTSADMFQYTYPKSQLSTASQIREALDNIEVSVDLSAYYKKTETSSSTEISNAISGTVEYMNSTFRDIVHWNPIPLVGTDERTGSDVYFSILTSDLSSNPLSCEAVEMEATYGDETETFYVLVRNNS